MSSTPGWATLRAHRTPIRTLNISKNGLRLISGDDEGWVVLWSLESLRPVVIWHAHDNALLTTDFWQRSGAPEEELMVTHGRDNKLRIWQAPNEPRNQQRYNTEPLPPHVDNLSEKYIKPWLLYSQDINALNFCSVALSQASNFAAPATIASEKIDIYSLDSNFTISRPHKALDAADSLPLDTQLENEAAQSKRRGLLGAVMALQFYNDYLLAGYESGHVALFDTSTGEVKFLVQSHKEPILSLAVVNEGLAFASASDRKISVIDLVHGRSRVAAQLTRRGVASLDTLVLPNSGNDMLLISAGWDGKVRLFQTSGADDTSRDLDINEIESFSGGRQSGITVVRIGAVDHEQAGKRRLRPLPPVYIAVAGKDGRIGLHAYHHLYKQKEIGPCN